MLRFSAVLFLAACGMEPAPTPMPAPGTCDGMTIALFVREFSGGVEKGCDYSLNGSLASGEELERAPCVDVEPGNYPSGPYGLGANIFTFVHAGEMATEVSFDGFGGSSTLLFSESECASGGAWRSISIYK